MFVATDENVAFITSVNQSVNF